MATAVNITDTGRPAPVKTDPTASKMKAMFVKQSEEQRIKAETMQVASSHEKYLQEREQAIKLAQKWSLNENTELRKLITGCTDNVCTANDIMRYYDQTFERLFSTIDRCIKEKKHLHDLHRDLVKLDKRMDKLERKEMEKIHGQDRARELREHSRRPIDDLSSISTSVSTEAMDNSAKLRKNVRLAEETQTEILMTYRNMHQRIRRALYNLTVARIEQFRKLIALDLTFLDSLNEFKYPSLVRDDGIVEFSSFAHPLPPKEEVAGWYDASWQPPAWLGDNVLATLDSEQEGNISSAGTSPGGSPAPMFPSDHHHTPLEKGLYPGKAAGKSMTNSRHYDDPIDHPNRPVQRERRVEKAEQRAAEKRAGEYAYASKSKQL